MSSEAVKVTYFDWRRCEPLKTPAVSWIAAFLLVIYPVSAIQSPIYANIHIADVVLIGLFPLLFIGRFRGMYFQFMSTGYGYGAGLITAFTCIGSIVSSSRTDAIEAVLQFSVIIWMLLPVISIGISQMKAPLMFLEIGAWINIFIMLVGTVLIFRYGLSFLVDNTGANRYIMTVQWVAFSACVAPIAVGRLITTKRIFSWRVAMYLLLLSGAAFSAIIGNSRTSMASIGMVVIFGLLVGKRSFMSIALIMTPALLALIVLQQWFRDNFNLLQRGVFDDSSRIQALASSLKIFGHDIVNLLFGSGWNMSGVNDPNKMVLVVHNVYAQVLLEWGLLGFGGWMIIWMLPIRWIANKKEYDYEKIITTLLAAIIFISWLFHPIATTRVDWLGFAVLLGMAYRIKNRRHSPVCRNN